MFECYCSVKKKIMKKITVLILVLLTFQGWSQVIQYYQTGEEFCGPFASWKNVKTDFGAKGDGITDDAPAINAALLAMKKTQTNPYNVLYFPAGTYLIDTTLYNPGRNLGDDYSGMALIGEDPATTIIKAGPQCTSDMMNLNGWYMRVSRLTFDGNNIAGTGILHSGGFSTGCEWSDLVFKNMYLGLDFSSPTNGQAENAILRCRFEGMKFCGINSCNWNSLDHWVWNCVFTDCKKGINLCIGYYQIYDNVFLNSHVFDIGGGNTYQSAAVNNISVGSKCFWASGPGYLRGNKIYTAVDSFYMVGAQMIDNIIRDGHTHYPVYNIVGLNIVGEQNLLVGNTFANAHRLYPFSWPVQPERVNFDHGVGASFIVGHPVEKAIDNDISTWFTTGMSYEISGLRWNCMPPNSKTVVKYTVTQGAYDHTADPRDWQLRGSNDWGFSWTILDSRTNQTWGYREKKSFTLTNTQPFLLYEFNILANENGQVPGSGAWVSIGEIEFLDAQNHDITEDQDGLLTGADESWGLFTPLQNQTVDTNAIAVPDTIYCPGPPENHHRKTFEVYAGSGNDATLIQQKIDSAALLPLGSKPVIHFPKGIYDINTTLIVPKEKDMQLVGDGLGSGTITTFNWTGGNTGPMIKCQGPSRVTIKDIFFQVQYHENAGLDALLIEDPDQPGGRIYANQFWVGASDAAHPSQIGLYSDGIENSDITVTCSSIGSAVDGVIKARGGAVLASGGNTNGQISILTGATGGSQKLFNVSDGGKIDAEGFWYEGNNSINTTGLIDLNNTSGKVSLACMEWNLSNTSFPMIRTNNFQGTLTMIDNAMKETPKMKIRMEGNGTNGNIFAAYNYLVGQDSLALTTDSIWQDATAPNANTSLLGCDANASNKFIYLDQVVNKDHHQLPDSTFILNAISQLREVRTEPPNDRIPGVTDVKLFRVAAHVVEGNTAAHFISTKPSGIGPSLQEKSVKLMVFPNPADNLVNVGSENIRTDGTLFVTDLTGRLIKTVFVPANTRKITVLVSDLNPGCYLLKLIAGQESLNGKLIIR